MHLRNALLWLTLTDLFKARWTDQIHNEWIRNVSKNRGIDKKVLERTRDLMDANVRDCKVYGYDYLIPSLSLPDENDRHVLAAAIRSSSDAIVTSNLKDFPSSELQKYNIEAIHPDDFILYQFDFDAGAVIKAFRNQRASLRNPPFDQGQFLDCLSKQQLPQTVSELRKYMEFI